MGWEEVIGKVDPEQYLDHMGVDYRITHGGSGKQLNIKDCPFCGGSSYKVYMNSESGLGNCFSGSCGKGTFNLTQFAQAVNGLNSFKETAAHIKAYLRSLGWRPARKPRVQAPPIDTSVLPPSWPLPMSGNKIHPYLAERGISAEMCAMFGLRYCPKGDHVYVAEGEEKRQSYKKRVIIPIRDIEGNVVSFQGRDVTGEAIRKYLFPPGSATQRWLYNADLAKNHKHLVVCEGVFDVIGATQSFQEIDLDVGVVATFGKHMSADQFALIQKMVSKHKVSDVTMMYDSEKPAIKAAIQIALRLHAVGVKVRIALLPKDKDPAECSLSELEKAFFGAKLVDRSVAARLRLQIS